MLAVYTLGVSCQDESKTLRVYRETTDIFKRVLLVRVDFYDWYPGF